MSPPIVKEADPPLSRIVAEADPVLAQCHDGDYESEDYTDDFLIDWCAVTIEADPGRRPISVEADPALVTHGTFDRTYFNLLFYRTPGLFIDDAPLPVAIMAEADV